MMQTNTIEYTIIRSNRRSVSLVIDADARLTVRAPYRMPDRAVAEFVASKQKWIEKHLEQMRQRAENRAAAPTFTKEEREALLRRAMEIIPVKVAHFAKIIGVAYGRITIRNQKTLWGSCSTKGNLNFNYMLAALPDEVVDYVVVHELCHRKEMNHSPKFWAEVEKVVPDCKRIRKWLKEEGSVFLER